MSFEGSDTPTWKLGPNQEDSPSVETEAAGDVPIKPCRSARYYMQNDLELLVG